MVTIVFFTASRGDHADPVMFQCEHCNEKFTYNGFEKHVCAYDENHRPIVVELAEPESELKQDYRRVSELVEKNRIMMKNMMLSESKDKPVDCPICCRKFVKEDGLYRHWDRHIGEILEPSPECTGSKMALIVCTLCCEVFSNSSEAWKHVVRFHVTMVNGSAKIRNASNRIVTQESKKQKFDEVRLRLSRVQLA